MPESPDQGPPAPFEAPVDSVADAGSGSRDSAPSTRESAEQAPAGVAIPLLPRVTAPAEARETAEDHEPGDAPEPIETVVSAGTTVSTVGLPRRHRSGFPIPWAMRRGGDDGPLRNWVPLGTVDSGVVAAVDPGGLVQLTASDWSLDWWIRAEDRWHHPSMEAAVSQVADENSAVLATAMRVPGGEVTQRCAAAQVRAGAWSGTAAVIEVTNDSAVPVALVLVVRPYRLDGRGRVSSVEMCAAVGPSAGGGDASGTQHGGAPHDGVVVRVDGTDVLLVDRRPVRVAHGTPADVATALAAGSDDKLEGAAEPLAARRWDATGQEDLEVAFVFPLAHTATLSAAVSPVGGRAGGRGPFNRSQAIEPAAPLGIPELSSVTRGWALHSADDPELAWVVDAAGEFLTWSAAMLRVAGPDAVTAALDPAGGGQPRSAAVDLAALCRAFGSMPAGELHMAVAAALIRVQRFSGRVEPRRGDDVTVALLWVVAPVLWGMHGARYADELVGPLAAALKWLERELAGRPDRFAVSGESAASDEALRRLAVGLSVVGQPGLAEHAIGLAGGVREAAPGDLAGIDHDDERPGGRGEGLARRLLRDLPAVMPGARRYNRQEGAGVPGVGTGFDVVELADLRNRLVASVVSDAPEGPALFGLWSAEWNGRPLEVHRMPSAWGRVSVGVRWHGSRPAVLWDVQPWLGVTDGVSAPVVSAPGFSPGWTATGWKGEVLLDDPPAGFERC